MRSNSIEPASHVQPLYRSHRVAHAPAPQFAPAQAALQPAAATTPPRPAIASDDGLSVHRLHDQYTAHCLRNAVLAYHAQLVRLQERSIAVNQAWRDEQATLQARADAANDLGTIQGLLPQLPYRHAVGVPPIVAQPFTAAAGVAQAQPGSVVNVAKTRGKTENASEAERPAPTAGKRTGRLRTWLNSPSRPRPYTR